MLIVRFRLNRMAGKITIFLICTVLVFAGIIMTPNAYAENVPGWVKNTAGWWATDAISETELVKAIGFMINVVIINLLV